MSKPFDLAAFNAVISPSAQGVSPFDDAFSPYQSQKLPEPPPPPPPGDVAAGFKTALGQTPALAKGVVGAIGGALEQFFGEGGISTGLKNWGIEGYQRGMQELSEKYAQPNHDAVTAWEKAKEGDIGALVDFVQYAFGYGLAQVGESVAAAVIGSIIGGAAGGAAAPATAVAGAAAGVAKKSAIKSLAERWVTNAVAETVAKSGGKLGVKAAAKQLGARWGSTAGLAAFGITQEVGSIYPEAEEQAAAEGRKLTAGEVAKAWGLGIIAGLTETAADRFQLDAILGRSSVMRAAVARMGPVAAGALGGVVGMGVESGTELLQTGMEQIGAGKPLFSDEANREYINAAAMAAVPGLGGGVVSGVMSRQRAQQTQPPPTEPLTDQEVITELDRTASVDEAIAVAGALTDTGVPMSEAQLLSDRALMSKAAEEAQQFLRDRDWEASQAVQGAQTQAEVSQAFDTRERRLGAVEEAQRDIGQEQMLEAKGDVAVEQELAAAKAAGMEEPAGPTAMGLAMEREVSRLSSRLMDGDPARMRTTQLEVLAARAPDPAVRARALELVTARRNADPGALAEAGGSNAPQSAPTGGDLTFSRQRSDGDALAQVNEALNRESPGSGNWQVVDVATLPVDSTPHPGSPVGAMSRAQESVRLAQGFADLFGKRVVPIRNLNARPGEFMGGTVIGSDTERVFLNVDSPDASPVTVAGHEVFHQMERDAPDLAKKVFAAIGLTGAVKADKVAAPLLTFFRYYEPGAAEMSDEQVLAELAKPEKLAAMRREIAADFFGNRAGEYSTLKTIFKAVAESEDKGLIYKVASYIMRAIDSILRRLKLKKFDVSDAVVAKLVKDLEGAKQATRDAMAEYAKRQGLSKMQAEAAMREAMVERAKASAQPKPRLDKNRIPILSKQRAEWKKGPMGSGAVVDGQRLLVRRVTMGDGSYQYQAIVAGAAAGTAKTEAAARALAEQKIAELSKSRQRTEVRQFASTGKLVGAPPGKATVADRDALVKRLYKSMLSKNAVFDESHLWYEKSGDMIRALSGRDETLMESVVRLFALYSQSNSIQGNVTAVVKSLVELARSPTAHAGRFPNTTAELIPQVLIAEEFDKSLPGINDKVLSFYQNLHDATFRSDKYAQESTQDRWMMRLMGYPHAEDDNGDVAGSTGFSPTQYAYARDVTIRVADEYNRTHPGAALLPRQVQAALWSWVKNEKAEQEQKQALKEVELAIKALKKLDPKELVQPGKPKTVADALKALTKRRDEIAKFEPQNMNFADVVDRVTAAVTWEAAPGMTSGRPLPGSVPSDVRRAYTRAMLQLIVDEKGNDSLLELLGGGTALYRSTMETGAFEGKINPNVVTAIVLAGGKASLDTAIADTYAAALAILFRQDAYAWHRADPTLTGKEASVGLSISFPGTEITEDFEERFFQHLRGSVDKDVGYSRLHHGDEVVFRLVNFRDKKTGKPFGMPDKVFEAKIEAALNAFDTPSTVVKFKAQSEYVTNDWQANPNGEGYQARVGEAYRSRVQDWLDRLRPAADAVHEGFARQHGWPAPGLAKSGQRSGSGRVEAARGWSSRPAQAQAAEVTGIHYGRERTPVLSGSKYGTGIRGAEAARLAQATDPRIKRRIYFYVADGETLPRPEANLGLHTYTQKFTNLYDVSKVDTRFPSGLDANGFESAVLDLGYDGYVNRARGMLVVLDADVPVEYLGERTAASRTVADLTKSAQRTDTPMFRKWFGDSKVINEDGSPKVVYHGTASDVDAFDPSERGRASGAYDEQAFYFADNPDAASGFAKDAGRNGGAQNVIPVYLSVQNPLVVTRETHEADYGYDGSYDKNTFASILVDAMEAGHDGVIFRKVYERGTSDQYAVFEPTQIKSIYNEGTWSPTDARLSLSNQRWPEVDPPVMSKSEQRAARFKPPTKTVTAYKLFQMRKDGKLYPLFIDAKEPTPVGEWVVAKFTPTKGYAPRPGWHAGALPFAPHLRSTKTQRIGKNRVWAEVEMPADTDWQTRADRSPTRDIRDRVPAGGHYRFRTNKMQGGAWLIGGALRIKKVLSDAEVARILTRAGELDQIDAEMRGDGTLAKSAQRMSAQREKAFEKWSGGIKLVDVIEDASPQARPTFRTGKPFVAGVYHGSPNEFYAFNNEMLGSNTGAGSARMGHFAAATRGTSESYTSYVGDGEFDAEESLSGDISWEGGDPELVFTAEEPRWMDFVDHDPDAVRTDFPDSILTESDVAMLREFQSLADDIVQHDSDVATAGEGIPTAQQTPRPDNRDILEYAIQQGILKLPEVYYSRVEFGEWVDNASFFIRKEEDGSWVYGAHGSPVGVAENRGMAEMLANELLRQEIDKRESGDGSVVHELYLRSANPYVHDYRGKPYREISYAAVIAKAKKAGHDAVVLKNTFDGGGKDNIFVFFDPNQVKLRDSKAFSTKSDDIRKSAQRADLPRGTILPMSEEEYALRDRISDKREEVNAALMKGMDRVNATMREELLAQGFKPREVAAFLKMAAFRETMPDGRFPRRSHEFFAELRAREEELRSMNEKVEELSEARFGPPEFDAMRQLSEYPRAQVDTPEFKRWFKNSKVVDREGRPLIALHGSQYNIREFKTVQTGLPRKNRSQNNWLGELGTWFAAPNSSPSYDVGNAETTADVFAELRGEDKGVVYPVFLSIQKPYEADYYEQLTEERDEAGGARAFREKLISEGYDGVVVRDSDTDGNQIRDDWVAFYPEQIKSAIGNSGTFDPSNADISKSAQRAIESAEFRRWSRGAPVASARKAVLFETGKPVVVADMVHGSPWASKLRAFDRNAIGSGMYGSASNNALGWHFTDSLRTAASYAKMGMPLAEGDETIGQITPQGAGNIGAFIRLDNPLVMKGATYSRYFIDGDTETIGALINYMDQKGHDGIIIDFSTSEPAVVEKGTFMAAYDAVLDDILDARNKLTKEEKIDARVLDNEFSAWATSSAVDPLPGWIREGFTFLLGRDIFPPNDAIFESIEQRERSKQMVIRTGNRGLIAVGVTKAMHRPEIIPYGDSLWVVVRPSAADRGHIKSIDNEGRFTDDADIYRSKQRTDTPEFRAWFGDSKVVDEKGAPLVVYHGTIRDFDAFDPSETFDGGLYFTDNAGHAAEYAEIKGGGDTQIMPVYLTIRDPMEIDARSSDLGNQFNEDWQQLLQQLILDGTQAGNDGVIVRNMDALGYGDDSTIYIAFRPEQIKSAIGNRGTFDATSPDITKSKPRINIGTLTPAQQATAERVGAIVEPITWQERWDTFKQDLGLRLQQGVFDQFAPIAKLSYEAYQYARMSKGSDGTLEASVLYGRPFLRDGVPDVDINDGGFADVIATLADDTDRFFWWVAAQRARMLKRQGKENLFSDIDIANFETLNDPDAAHPDRRQKFSAALSRLNDFNEAMLKIALESDLIDKEAYELFKDQPYLPFYRVMAEEGGVRGPGFGKGLLNQYAWKKLKGGSEALNQDLLSNLLQNWAHLLSASAKNRAAVAAAEAAMPLGVIEQVPSGTPKAVRMRVEGKEQHFLIHDPHLYTAMSAITYATPSWFKPFSTVKRALTIGVTASPAFKIRNLIRDSVQSLATGKLDPNMFANVMQGWKASTPGTQTYASMMASGGMIRFGSSHEGARSSATRKIASKRIDPATILDGGGWAKLQRKMSDLFDAYQEMGDRSENINRNALYEQLVAKGYSHREAAFMSRDLMDFQMGGAWPVVRFLAQSVPFLNARLQGLYKLGKSAKDDPVRVGYTVGAVILASMVPLLMYGDDDDWKRREDWDRDNYWWFKIGDTAFRIPKPFEIGAIGTLAERTWELGFDKEMTGSRYSRRIVDTIAEQFALNPTPQIIKPMVDLYANRDSFTGRAIESMGMERKLPADRARAGTSTIALALGSLGLPNPAQLANARYEPLSPVQIDHLVRAYFGWLGTVTVAGLDYGLRPMTDRGPRPEMKLKDVFLAGAFVETLPPNSSRYVTQMYEQARQAEQWWASYRDAQKYGDTARAAEIMTEHRDKLVQYQRLKGFTEGVSQLGEQVRRIEASRNLSPETKRKMIDALEQRRHEMARRAPVQ